MADDVHRIELRAKSVQELRSFLDGADLDFGCRPVLRRLDDGYVVEVYATLPVIERLRSERSAPGVTMSVVENVSEVGRNRQIEVEPGNRFADGTVPSGLGIKE